MKKSLSEMSLEELWQLFPIYLTKPDEKWCDYYNNESACLSTSLDGCRGLRINHIGSTAIRGIYAKPIIDILIEISPDEDMEKVATVIENCGYICMNKKDGRISFNKGYTENGFADKVYHLHLRFVGDNGELYFRDYLNDNPTIAKRYEELKLKLWKEYEHNRDAYTDAKSEFVQKYTWLAKEFYGNKY